MNSIIKPVPTDYSTYLFYIEELIRDFPFLNAEIQGRTAVGRGIFSLSLGNRKNAVLIAGGFCGSEIMTVNMLLLFTESLCRCVKYARQLWGVDVKRALSQLGVTLIPCVNPDGCEIALKGELACGENSGWFKRLCGGDFAHWNANFRGVDINHNFDAGWEELHNLERESGYFGPGPTRYGGPCPHSEPETKALVEYCETHNVCYVIAFHSQGELIYWDYKNIPTHRGRKMAEIFSASTGYALDIPTGLSAGGGFKDWFIERFRRPGFTVEMGLGKNPLPAESGEKIYETLEEMMMIGLLM